MFGFSIILNRIKNNLYYRGELMIKIIEVTTHKQLRDFIYFHSVCGQSILSSAIDNGWYNTLDKKNPAFEYCDAKYWLCYKDGKLAGRIAEYRIMPMLKME